MMEIRQSETFRRWRENLKDRRARVIIAARIARLAEGLAGDAQPVGEGVSELRIHYGPGYRVYFRQTGARLILLLCGGDKSSQNRDIADAKRIFKEWEKENG
jgi:putative addiction module killer protein